MQKLPSEYFIPTGQSPLEVRRPNVLLKHHLILGRQQEAKIVPLEGKDLS